MGLFKRDICALATGNAGARRKHMFVRVVFLRVLQTREPEKVCVFLCSVGARRSSDGWINSNVIVSRVADFRWHFYFSFSLLNCSLHPKLELFAWVTPKDDGTMGQGREALADTMTRANTQVSGCVHSCTKKMTNLSKYTTLESPYIKRHLALRSSCVVDAVILQKASVERE